MKNHYDILGISRTASQDEIKTAYRKLSLKFHPDKNNGEVFFAEMFKQVNEAYTTLYDSAKRAKYDKELYNFEHQQKIVQNYPNSTSANSKVNTQPRPTYNNSTSRTDRISVWDQVERWRKVRNYLLAINGILFFILLASNSGSTQKQNIEPTKDSTPVVKYIILHKHRHRKKAHTLVDTINIHNQDSISNETLVKPTTKDTLQKDTQVLSVKPTEQNYNVNTKLDSPKKRRGFFRRLFGKKTN